MGTLKLFCALRQRSDGFMEKANSFFGLIHRLRFRFLVERGEERRFFFMMRMMPIMHEASKSVNAYDGVYVGGSVVPAASLAEDEAAGA